MADNPFLSFLKNPVGTITEGIKTAVKALPTVSKPQTKTTNVISGFLQNIQKNPIVQQATKAITDFGSNISNFSQQAGSTAGDITSKVLPTSQIRQIDAWTQKFSNSGVDLPIARQEQEQYQIMGKPGGEEQLQKELFNRIAEPVVDVGGRAVQALGDTMDTLFNGPPIALHKLFFENKDLGESLKALIPQGRNVFGIESSRQTGDENIANAFNFGLLELGNMGINISNSLKGSIEGLKNNVMIADDALNTLGIKGLEINATGSNTYQKVLGNIVRRGEAGKSAQMNEALKWVKENPLTARIVAVSKRYRIDPEQVYKGFAQDLTRLALPAPEQTIIRQQIDSIKEFIQNPRRYVASRMEMRPGFIDPGRMIQDIGTSLKSTKKKPSITDLGVSVPSVPEPFQDSGKLTTKILDRLQNKTVVSKQYIADLAKQQDVQQVEKNIINRLLESEPNMINVQKFADKVKAELLPLERESVSDRNGEVLYKEISLPEDLKGKVKKYDENLYRSPISTSAGSIHFSRIGGEPKYFGHTRVEDMADGYTRRVIEVQSDLYQKGNLDREFSSHKDDFEMRNDVPYKNQDFRMTELKKLEQYKDPTAHFRMIREELKKAAEDGKSTVLFPTGDTAMKIEDLGAFNPWVIEENGSSLDPINTPKLKVSELKKGLIINRGIYGQYESLANKWIITEVLGNGIFKAVPKDSYVEGVEKYANAETFDISGKLDTNNPIHKFYETEVGKYLKNNYSAEPYTDDKGVTWWKVDLKSPRVKTSTDKPVFAFKTGGGSELTPGYISEQARNIIDRDNDPIPTKTEPVQPSADIHADNDAAPISGLSKENIAQSIPEQKRMIEQKTFNQTNEEIKTTVLGKIANLPGKIQEPIRKVLNNIGDKFNTVVENALVSDNSFVRNAANFAHSFAKGIGRPQDFRDAADYLKGGISRGIADANIFQQNLYKAINNDPVSKQKIWSLMDPELFAELPAERRLFEGKVTEADLSPTEKQVYDMLREVSNYMSDVNFVRGQLSEETYQKYKGKYIARMYDQFELPAEVQKFITSGTKQDLSMFKERGDINEWKAEHTVTDPIYLTAKRWAQTEINNAVQDYMDFISTKKKNLVSDTERKGFTQMSDSKAYGSLAGKWVANQVVEDIKGFFFTNDTMNKVYDVFKGIDRSSLIQLQKKVLTIYNPGVQLGNVGSDYVFAFLTGVDPLTFSKNLPAAIKEVVKYGNVYRDLLKENVVSTDFTRSDLVSGLKDLSNDGISSNVIWNKIKDIASVPQEVYGAVDDIAKISSYISLLKQGYSKPDAIRLVKDGFQNYANVGKVYDFASKTPIIGNKFIKFQADLLRIIKNSVKNRPLHVASFLIALKTIGDVLSQQSGESQDERNIREGRFGFPVIPFFNIPLSFQTPAGELNVARFISPYYVYNNTEGEPSVQDAIARFAPYQLSLVDHTSNPAGIIAVDIAKTVQDPLLSPLIQLAVNSDFRGKPIWDPTETKYAPSTATQEEKNANALMFLFRSYAPQTVKDGQDFMSAMQGKPDYYGRQKTQTQAFLRFFGIRQEQFGKEQVQQEVLKQIDYVQKDWVAVQNNIAQINKQLRDGKIDNDTAQKRMAQPLQELVDIRKQLEDLNITSQKVGADKAVGSPKSEIDRLNNQKKIQKDDIYKRFTNPDGTKNIQAYQAGTTEERKLYNEVVSSKKATETKKTNDQLIRDNIGIYKQILKAKDSGDMAEYKRLYQTLDTPEKKQGLKTFLSRFE